MKIIICLIIVIAGAFWLFHGRGARVSPPPSLREVAAEAATKAKTAIMEAQRISTKAIRLQPVKPEPSAFDRIVAGEKVREQPATSMPPPPKPAGSAAINRILRGERIVENKRAAAQ